MKKKEQNEVEKLAERLAIKIIDEIKIKNPFFEIMQMSFVWSLFLVFVCVYVMGLVEAHQMKKFSMIEDNYAIIYQDTEHYWTVEADREENVLTLNVKNQRIMSIENVEYYVEEFEDVVIQYEK